jgi:predicted aconitase
VVERTDMTLIRRKGIDQARSGADLEHPATVSPASGDIQNEKTTFNPLPAKPRKKLDEILKIYERLIYKDILYINPYQISFG